MRKVTADKRRGIWWNFTTLLVDLDFADNITLLSSKFSMYTFSDLGVLRNLIGSLSLANEHYSPPTE